MAKATPALVFVYSGGAANSSPAASLGGQVSQTVGRIAVSQSFTQPGIPGIEVQFAARNPLGSGTLFYASANQTVTWTPLAGSPSVAALADGLVAVGSDVAGYLNLQVTMVDLPGGDATENVVIDDVAATVFDTPTPSDLAGGATEYRCLYIVNQTGSPVYNVQLVLTQDTPATEVTLGTVFAASSQFQTTFSEMNTLVRFNPILGGAPYTTALDDGGARERLLAAHRSGLPFVPFAEGGRESSDGVSLFVPPLLADRYDSTGLLSEVDWGSALSWPEILPDRMVSIWLRRVTPVEPTPSNESINLDLTITVT